MRLWIFIIFSNYCLANPHAERPGPARNVAKTKTCVCQYQKEPGNCANFKKEPECKKKFDCNWVTIPNGPSVCVNQFQEYCEQEYKRKVPGQGCSTVVTIPTDQPLPICDTEEYDYFHSGHGDGGNMSVAYMMNLNHVLLTSQPQCQKISFRNMGCSIFDVNSAKPETHALPYIRDFIKLALIPVVRADQIVTVSGNQMMSGVSFPRVRGGDSQINSLSWGFTFNSKEITEETLPQCNSNFFCLSDMHSQHYLCKKQNNIVRQTCCCKDSVCEWNEQVLACPK